MSIDSILPKTEPTCGHCTTGCDSSAPTSPSNPQTARINEASVEIDLECSRLDAIDHRDALTTIAQEHSTRTCVRIICVWLAECFETAAALLACDDHAQRTVTLRLDADVVNLVATAHRACHSERNDEPMTSLHDTYATELVEQLRGAESTYNGGTLISNRIHSCEQMRSSNPTGTIPPLAEAVLEILDDQFGDDPFERPQAVEVLVDATGSETEFDGTTETQDRLESLSQADAERYLELLIENGYLYEVRDTLHITP